MKKNVPIQERKEQANEDVQEPENGIEMIRDPEDSVDGEDQEPESGSDGEDQDLERSTDGEDQKPEDTPRNLIAVYPILYHSHQYKIGDTLPANDPEMVKAWLDAETAKWQVTGEEKAMAKPGTALPGLPGQATHSKAGCRDDLVGRIPERGPRKK